MSVLRQFGPDLCLVTAWLPPGIPRNAWNFQAFAATRLIFRRFQFFPAFHGTPRHFMKCRISTDAYDRYIFMKHPALSPSTFWASVSCWFDNVLLMFCYLDQWFLLFWLLDTLHSIFCVSIFAFQYFVPLLLCLRCFIFDDRNFVFNILPLDILYSIVCRYFASQYFSSKTPCLARYERARLH